MGSKKSSSSSSNATTTNNIDRRMALENSSALTQDGSAYGEVANNLDLKASGKNSRITLNNSITNYSTDYGAVDSAFDAVNKNSASAFDAVNKSNSSAFEFAKNADATNGAGFSKLLDLATDLFEGAGDAIYKQQESTLAQLSSITSAKNDAAGSIDQKTLIIAALGIGAVALLRK